jgi:hypothetical protein
MGNRAFIQIDSKRLETPVILYGHHSGEDNLTAVKNVLERTDRIGNPSYLTAQIFYEFAMNLGGYTGELGFGIDSGHLAGNEDRDVPSVFVNADTGEYSCEGVSYTEFMDRARISLLY